MNQSETIALFRELAEFTKDDELVWRFWTRLADDVEDGEEISELTLLVGQARIATRNFEQGRNDQ